MTNPQHNTSNARIWKYLQTAALLAYVLIFQAIWLSEPLFATGDSPEQRIARWQLLFLPDFTAGATSLLHSLLPPTFLLERIPILSVALAVWSMAYLSGRAILPFLLPNAELTRAERWAASSALGMALISLFTLGLGFVGILNRTTIGLTTSLIFLAYFISRWKRSTPRPAESNRPAISIYERLLILLIVAVAMGLAILAASIPTPDYDAHAYHLLAPKEYYLAGHIQFLPHNVYATFPFFTEMFHLLAMVILDDWFLGGLAGQVTLAGFGVLGTASVALAAGRIFGPTAAWWAAFVYATTPWIYRLTAIPYVEGAMLAYLAIGLWAVACSNRSPGGFTLLAGMFAGAASACKYPAVIVVAIPLAALAAIRTRPRVSPATIAAFAVGFLLVAGPWFVRNLAWTGNPVYPLAYDSFGGDNWTPQKHLRFSAAHQPKDFALAQIPSFARDILTRSDWQSALLFAFAPLAFLATRRRWTLALTVWILYSFLIFYFATHRLDRFFLTIEPLAAILAAAGIVCFAERLGRLLTWVVLLPAVLFNILFCTTPLCGMNQYAEPIQDVRSIAAAAVSQSLADLKASGLVQPSQGVLFVGLAAVYDFPARAYYNTVFDDNRLEAILTESGGNLRPSAEIAQSLREQEIDFVFVDWNWINLYRSPGNYGFTDFVQPEIFATLVSQRLLEPVWPPDPKSPYTLYRVRNPSQP